MPNSPKYYIYISDTKVDMLYNQIPSQRLREFSGEFKIDLKIIGASLNKSSQEQNRYTKVRLVTDYLQRNGDCGTIVKPLIYFYGSLPIRWGTLGNKLVYFGGSEGNTILGLGGSKYHILGEQKDINNPSSGLWSSSSALEIIQQLENISLEDNFHPAKLNLRLIASATKELKGQVQKCEFLAKALIHQFDRERNIYLLIGSPIYVALLE